MSSTGLQPVAVSSHPPVARKSGHYTCLDALGKGTYGICYKVVHKAGGSPCVMKVVPLSGLSNKDMKAAFSEAMILRTVKHSHVVGYHDAWVENSHLYIVMDYCSDGDLAVHLKTRSLTSEDIWGFARDISCGLEHLHSKKIMHRDIKPSNLLLNNKKVVIGDLGLGRHLEQHSLAHTQVGTPLYSAPEVCQGQPYTFSADVWAFGCALYEMVARAPPYIAVNQVALAEKICSSPPPALPDSCPPPLQHLILSTLQKSPPQRPSMHQCLQFVSSLPLHPGPASPIAHQRPHRGQIRHRLLPSTADDLFPGPGASNAKHSAPSTPAPGQLAPESPKLNAVQKIVDRLEARNSPKQPTPLSPVPSASASMKQTCPGAHSCTPFRKQELMPANSLRPSDLPAPDAAAGGPETDATKCKPTTALSTCVVTLNEVGDRSGCVACSEAQHELKTLACKVAGLQRLLASANQRADDEKRSSALLQRQRDRLQAVILDHGIPGAELLLMRSPAHSPARAAESISLSSPTAELPDRQGPAAATAVAVGLPAAGNPAETPAAQELSGLSQFQQACAALKPGTQHGESGSTSSPLALCATIACESPTAGLGRGARAWGADFASAGLWNRRGPALANPFPGSGHKASSIIQWQGPGVASKPATESHAGASRMLCAAPLQTPQRSAQHARAHVATPVDLQKLLRGGVEGQLQPCCPHDSTGCWPAGRAGRAGPPKPAARMGPAIGSPVLGAGAPDAPHPAVQVTGQAEGAPVGGMVLGGGQSATVHGTAQGRVQAGPADLGAPEASRAGCAVANAATQQHWLGHGTSAEAAAAKAPPTWMANQGFTVIESDVVTGVPQAIAGPAGPGRSRAADLRVTCSGGDRGSAVGGTGRLGVGACIPAPPGAAFAVDQQPKDVHAVAVRARLDPGRTLDMVPVAVQPDVRHWDGGGVQQQPAAVQSLWLWAGQQETAAGLACASAAVVSEQENIAPEAGWRQQPQRPQERSQVLAADQAAARATPRSQRAQSHGPAAALPRPAPAAPAHGQAQPECGHGAVGMAAAETAMEASDGAGVPSGRAAWRGSLVALDALYAGASAPQTPSGRSKATACYTATPRSPRTPRRRVTRPSPGTAARAESRRPGTPPGRCSPAQRGLAAGPVQTAATEALSCQRLISTPLAREGIDTGAKMRGVRGGDSTPVRPQSVWVGDALMRTPPVTRARAHTAAGAGDLRSGQRRPLVPACSREKLNEAFKRTSALLQRCKEPARDTGDIRDKVLDASLA